MIPEKLITIYGRYNLTIVYRILQGIFAYMQHRTGWACVDSFSSISDNLLNPRSAENANLRNSKGVIAIDPAPEVLDLFKKYKKKTVVIYGNYPQKTVPGVKVDDEKIGHQAAQHLLERGLTNLAYYGFNWVDSQRREGGFLEALRASGRTDLQVTANSKVVPYEVMIQPAFILNWLKKLPKPVGVFVFNDQTAGNMMSVCKRGGISVPGEVAILGVDNTERTERFGIETLSSVDPDIHRLGYEAARVLDELLQGHAPPKEPTLVTPLGVIGRKSTDVLASTDPDLVSALAIIHQQACDGLTAEQLAKQIYMSRRSLERHFLHVLGRSPGEEIRRVRLERVRQLLVDSALSLTDIAVRTGFEHQSHLSNFFRKQFGLNPRAYRQKFRMDQYRP